MNKVNIYEAKTHLSEYISGLKEDESIIICRRNKPIAEIRLLPKEKADKRAIGLAKDIFQVPESFFEDLPEDIIYSFSKEKHETTS